MSHTSVTLPALRCLCAGICALQASGVTAETPLGWIGGDFTSAYTQEAGTVEVTGQAMAVNDRIDFLDIREELIAGNRRLVDNSGDLHGWQGTVRVGLFNNLSMFYRRQEHDMTLKLGPIESVNVLSIDEHLNTTMQEAGLKWTFYQGNFLAANNEITSASLELAWLRNESEDFDLTFDSVSFTSADTSATISFADPQRAGVNQLEDDGWRARFIYSRSLMPGLVTSLWAGYSDRSVTSGTGTTIPIDAIREDLTQHFAVDERHYILGVDMNWQPRPRMPMRLSYEYINIHEQHIDVQQNSRTSGIALPGFLRSASLSRDDSNHILTGSVTWWVTPRIHAGLTGKLFSNQFLGVIPHYNNPLSAGFSDHPYGYIGLRLGLNLF